ncbi:MAG: AzlC family ABC transporter permease [Clostridia bacterium]|nr:AzlC family ABC transporter permease [Clostridia bacterium]
MMGLADALPIGLGYGPVAMAYGLLAKSAGLTLIQCVAMSIIVFAGASQFMALNLIAVGIGIGEIVLATFLINLRHLLMSMSISEKLLALNRGIRACIAFGVTDESFAVSSIRGGKLSTGYMLGLEILSYGFWVAGSGVGYMAGEVLPPMLQTSMGIALYAMFIGLLIPSAKKSKKVLTLAVLAALLNSVFGLFLTGGWPMIAATIIASLGVAVVLPEDGACNE